MTDLVQQGPFWLFLGGIIMAFNPCMLAVSPLVAGYVGGSKHKSYLFQSLLFLFGFSGSLALIGLGFGMLGGFLTTIQNSWDLILALIYFGLGIYMVGGWSAALGIINKRAYGFYQFRHKKKLNLHQTMPSFGAFGLGIALALVPSPCITPVVLAVSAYITPIGGALKGASYLFIFGLGHALPVIIAGSSAGILVNKVRRSRWVRLINPVIGIVLIVLSLYFAVMGLV